MGADILDLVFHWHAKPAAAVAAGEPTEVFTAERRTTTFEAGYRPAYWQANHRPDRLDPIPRKQ